MPEELKIRAYPSTFTKVVSEMTNAQKKWVIEAGFGPLLSFSLRTIPHEIGINVLWWFDHNGCEMCFDNKSIKIDDEDVNLILGLPRGKKEIHFKKDKETLAGWRARFPEKQGSRITEKNVSDAIANSTVADLFFKQNFMVLMTNLFLRTNKTGFVSQYALGFDGDFDNAKDYNWCKAVLQNLKDAHELWWENVHSQYYTGSLVFLLVSK